MGLVKREEGEVDSVLEASKLLVLQFNCCSQNAPWIGST